MHIIMWALAKNKKSAPKTQKVCRHGVNFLKNFVTKKPIPRKPLAKTKKMCYNIFWVPVIRLYRSAAYTSVQGYRTCDTVACLFLYLYYTAFFRVCQYFFQTTSSTVCSTCWLARLILMIMGFPFSIGKIKGHELAAARAEALAQKADFDPPFGVL